MASLEQQFNDNQNVLILTNLDDIGQPYSCNQWGNRHMQFGAINPIITNDGNNITIMSWFGTFSGNYIYYPSVAFLDHDMKFVYNGNLSSAGFGSYKINQLLSECGALCDSGPILGCTDIDACNYNQNADDDDGSCEYQSCLGCTDLNADNFDSDATIDDGSCVYPINFTFGNISSSSIEINLSNSVPIQGFQFTITDSPDMITINDAYGGRAEEFGFEVSASDLGIVIGFSFTGSLVPEGNGLLTILSYDGIGPTDICFNDIIVSDSNANSIGVSTPDCELLDIIANPGDINLDMLVNIQDIVILINFILGFDEPSSQQLINGDMDENGYLNILDVIRIVNQILGNNLSLQNSSDNDGIIEYQFIEDNLILTISSESDFSGVQIMINSDVNHDVMLKDNSHISLKQNYVGNQKRVLAYSLFNDSFDGHTAQFTIKDASNLSINDINIIVSDINGNQVNTEFKESYNDYDLVFDINSVYPNPFNPSTDIDFTLDKNTYVKLSVYNINGQEVDVIFEGIQDVGNHSYTWNASNFSSGIYYLNLKSKDNVAIKKAMFIK